MVLEYLPFDSEKFLQAGTIDFYNQYTSAVMLTTADKRNVATCSAVLLGPRIALTAAHCVCARKKSSAPEDPSMTRIDAMSCAENAYVTTVIYEEAYPDHLLADTASGYYTGDVHPHPDFQLLLDEKGDVVSGRADLALITLQTPVKGPIAYIPLGQAEVQADELLTMSGFGSDQRIGQMDRFRYFRMNKVTRAPEEGRTPYEQRGRYLYNGFDGGPCFREHVDGRRLVGIASLGTDKELSLTSTVFYRDWIESEIASIRGPASDSPPSRGRP